MTSPNWSIVIPTFNRQDILETTVRAYLAQEGDIGELEIIVVDDGSTDDTPAILRRLKEEIGNRLMTFHQENRGPAAARNDAIRHSRGMYILLAGDDVVPIPTLLLSHAQTHREHPSPMTAVLGHIAWSPSHPVTTFMKLLESAGWQFDYGRIDDPENVSPLLFYSSNVSLHRTLLLDELFDEQFKAACWEDVDLGLRLHKRGMRLYYNREALGYHVHPTTYERFVTRTRRAGYFEMMLRKKHGMRSGFLSLPRAMGQAAIGILLRGVAWGAMREKGRIFMLNWYRMRGFVDYVWDRRSR
ncbi:MAG: glycosyltransferase family 2 protein [Ignavibacterium sp.]|jgi:glycosyltransferase involved in cell wall biosynthesis